MSSLPNRAYDMTASVDQGYDLSALVKTAGIQGLPGPNLINSSTAVGSLPDASSNAPFILSTDSTGSLVATVTAGAFGRSWMGAITQAAAQALLGLGSAALLPASAFDAAGSASAAYASAIAYSANASNLSSGTVALGRLSGITTAQLSGTAGITNAQLAGSIAATKLVGTDITTVGALSSGSAASGFTVADACLSSNIPLKNAANAFSVGGQTITTSSSVIGLDINTGAAATTANPFQVRFNGTTYFVINTGGTANATGIQILGAGQSAASQIQSAYGSNATGLKLQSTYNIDWTNGTTGVFSNTTDTRVSRSSAGVLIVSDPSTTNGTTGITYKALAQTLQTVGSDTFTFTNATDSTYIAKRVIAVNAYSGSQTALTITATSGGTPTSVFNGNVSNPGSYASAECFGAGAGASGAGATVFGNNTTTNAGYTAAFGQGSSVTAIGGACFGFQNTVSGAYGLGFGNSTNIAGIQSIGIGKSATTTANGQIVLSTYAYNPTVYLQLQTTGTPNQRNAAFWGGSFSTTTEGSQLGVATLGVLNVLTQQTALTISAAATAPTISLAGPTTVASTNGNYLKLPSMAVANLTSASTAGFGATACVTDATATTVGSTVAGGGSNKVYVRSDGTNWLIF